MIALGSRPGTLQPVAKLGLVGVVLLTSLLFGLRGVVMFSPEPVRVQQHETAHQHDTGKTHPHHEHCPLCFLQMVLPWLIPDLGLCQRVFFALRLWLGETHAKDEFLKAIAARGPPDFGMRL
ncbi:DUF2946 family protein [Meiothermus sp.]|uniref:DUF2946 family protein n=1 Tax=Meiothermus sp. TaxID=1955249 RepID=UPI00307D385A